MGANAQTSVPTFTAGEILTAANMNISARTGIPVFADSTARDAAFGGTGEKTLAEGQFAYLESTNATQYYDGAAWQSVGVTPGLVCVKAETAFSAVASVTADNVFSATYTNYILTVRYTTSTTNNMNLQFRVGGVTAATNYNQQFLAGVNTTADIARVSSQTSYQLGRSTNGSFLSLVTAQISGVFLAEATVIANQVASADGAYASPVSGQHAGNHSTATSYDGFILSVSTGTFTGSYTVYGYSKTV